MKSSIRTCILFPLLRNWLRSGVGSAWFRAHVHLCCHHRHMQALGCGALFHMLLAGSLDHSHKPESVFLSLGMALTRRSASTPLALCGAGACLRAPAAAKQKASRSLPKSSEGAAGASGWRGACCLSGALSKQLLFSCSQGLILLSCRGRRSNLLCGSLAACSQHCWLVPCCLPAFLRVG